MTQKNEIIEEELEKVNGGYGTRTAKVYSFEMGDTFKNTITGSVYIVKKDYTDVIGDTHISVIWKKPDGTVSKNAYGPAYQFEYYSYLGKSPLE